MRRPPSFASPHRSTSRCLRCIANNPCRISSRRGRGQIMRREVRRPCLPPCAQKLLEYSRAGNELRWLLSHRDSNLPANALLPTGRTPSSAVAPFAATRRRSVVDGRHGRGRHAEGRDSATASTSGTNRWAGAGLRRRRGSPARAGITAAPDAAGAAERPGRTGKEAEPAGRQAAPAWLPADRLRSRIAWPEGGHTIRVGKLETERREVWSALAFVSSLAPVGTDGPASFFVKAGGEHGGHQWARLSGLDFAIA